MKFFTADIHFCDSAALISDYRPFKDVKAYNRAVIKNFNEMATKDDTIYIAGDLLNCNGPECHEWLKALSFVKKINAKIVLIIGNNEQRVIKYFFNENYENFVKCCKAYGIKEVYKSLDVKISNKLVHIVHQIVDGDETKINLFGHTHLCSGLYHPYGLCISTDLNHFRLFTEEQILNYLKRKHDFWEPDDNINYVNPFLVERDGEIVNTRKCSREWQKYMKCNIYQTKIKD